MFHKKSSSLSAVLATHLHRTPYHCQNLSPSSPLHNMRWTKIVLDTGFVHMRQDYESLPWSASHAYSNVWLERWRRVLVAPRFENQSLSSTCPTVLKRTLNSLSLFIIFRGNNVDLVLCVLLGHQNSKIANSMKLVNFALFSSQYHVFELKNIRGNLIAPNSNRWSLSNKIAMSQEDNRKIISLFGQEKSIFLHPWMLKDLM